MLEFIIIAAVIGVICFSRQGGLKMRYNGALGAVMSSSKANRGLWMVAVAAILGLIIWYFWSGLVSLQSSLLGSSVPVWWYVAGIVGIVFLIWFIRAKEESREKSMSRITWIMIFIAIGYGLLTLTNWVREDTICPDKQAITSVPATGMVLDLQSCWDESFMVLDLRETGVPKLAFNEQSSALEGRTIDEFALMQTSYQPGSFDGQGVLRFDRNEMRRLGLTKLSVFIAPAAYQPGAVPRFDEATLEALSK